MKIRDIKRTAPLILKGGEAVFLESPPGWGKTSVAIEIAMALGTRPVVLHPAFKEPIDFVGAIHVKDHPKGIKVMAFAPPEDLPIEALLDESDGAITLIYDDLPQAHPQVMNLCSRSFFSGERLIGPHPLAQKVHVMATGNRLEDAAAVYEVPTFARMRVHTITLEADARDWCDWASVQADIPETLFTFLSPGIAGVKAGPGVPHLTDFNPARKTNCSPRTLHLAGKDLLALAGESPDVVDEWLSGIVCPAFAPEFREYLRVWESLPDIEAILAGKEVSMEFASKIDILFIVNAALIKRAEEKHLGAIAQFVLRLPKARLPFAAWLFQDCCRKLPKLAFQKEILKWAIENQTILKSAV